VNLEGGKKKEFGGGKRTDPLTEPRGERRVEGLKEKKVTGLIVLTTENGDKHAP